VIPVMGEIREAWGLGSVWKTCCGTVYGMYYDEGSNKYIAMFLGKDEAVALKNTGRSVTRMEHTSHM